MNGSTTAAATPPADTTTSTSIASTSTTKSVTNETNESATAISTGTTSVIATTPATAATGTGTGTGTGTTGTSKIPSCIQDGWFSEVEPTWPGQKLSLALEGFSTDSILYNEKSEFQSILVFRSAQHGNVMVLDGVVRKCVLLLLLLLFRDGCVCMDSILLPFHTPLNASLALAIFRHTTTTTATATATMQN